VGGDFHNLAHARRFAEAKNMECLHKGQFPLFLVFGDLGSLTNAPHLLYNSLTPAAPEEHMPTPNEIAETIRTQITVGVLMSCGAREFVALDAIKSVDGREGGLMFRVGPSGKVCKVLVSLTWMDTYEVRYFAMTRGGKVTADEVTVCAYAEQLPATVRKMGDRERY
jgi:hypothetical protein